MPDSSADAPFDATSFLRSLTSRPGVYRMFDGNEKILYVGKARNLKKRVSSYFRTTGLSPKTQVLMSQMQRVEVTVTHTEVEALILENTLIKKYLPRYNILLRDDKSYPYIYLGSDDQYPRLTLHRGAQKRKGRYFGPYPNAGAARESLHQLQKMFPVRQCEDSFFSNRSRPCLQYQIKRCTAPCVGLITTEKYADDVRRTVLFLEGKSSELNNELVQKMEQAAQSLHYEQAAVYRDQIASLQRVQQKQYVSGESGDLDLLACVVSGGVACVQVFFVRKGVNLGNKSFFPRVPAHSSVEDVLCAFIAQYYLSHLAPSELILNVDPGDTDVLTTALSEHAGHKVKLCNRVRGERARWLALCAENAKQALAARLSSQAGVHKRLEELRRILQLETLPSRIECFDISHTQGECTVASCVVFDRDGARTSDYRRFNIKGIEPGDDYAAMAQALSRRYTRLKKDECKLPDIVLIDGGKGQVSTAIKVLEELQISESLVVGVAKGEGRKPGLEILHIPAQARELDLAADSPALHLIQQIRDEAHRFAITGHRQRRAKARNESPLQGIPGVGPKRRQQLLKQFGGLREISRAGVEDLSRVPGISTELARQIYDTFHGDD